MAALDTDLMDTKEFKAALKQMGKNNAQEFLKKENSELEDLIVVNTLTIDEQTKKTKNNSKYKEILEAKKAFDEALRDANKPFTVAVELATLILNSRK